MSFEIRLDLFAFRCFALCVNYHCLRYDCDYHQHGLILEDNQFSSEE